MPGAATVTVMAAECLLAAAYCVVLTVAAASLARWLEATGRFDRVMTWVWYMCVRYAQVEPWLDPLAQDGQRTTWQTVRRELEGVSR